MISNIRTEAPTSIVEICHQLISVHLEKFALIVTLACLALIGVLH